MRGKAAPKHFTCCWPPSPDCFCGCGCGERFVIIDDLTDEDWDRRDPSQFCDEIAPPKPLETP